MSSTYLSWKERFVQEQIRAQLNRRIVPGPGRPSPTPPTGAPLPAAGAPLPADPEPAPAPRNYLDVRTPSDTWKLSARRERTPRPEEVAEAPPGRPRMRRDERRRETLSIAVSVNEEKMIRAAVAEAGVSLSEWARTAMFRHMGKGVPARDTRVRDWEKPERTGEEKKR